MIHLERQADHGQRETPSRFTDSALVVRPWVGSVGMMDGHMGSDDGMLHHVFRVWKRAHTPWLARPANDFSLSAVPAA